MREFVALLRRWPPSGWRGTAIVAVLAFVVAAVTGLVLGQDPVRLIAMAFAAAGGAAIGLFLVADRRGD